MTVYNSKQVEGLALINDGLTMVQDGINKLIEKEEPKETKKPTLKEIQSLKSTEETSSKGPYQLVTKAKNSDNPAFQKLQSYITEKGGFVNLYNLKLWNFSRDPENKIGIRKQ